MFYYPPPNTYINVASLIDFVSTSLIFLFTLYICYGLAVKRILFTPFTLRLFVLEKDAADLASVETPVETVMDNNGLLLELDYFITEGIEGVLFSLDNGFLFGS